MDHFYTGHDVRSGKSTDNAVGLNPGGFSNILEVIRHYTQELTLGTYAHTRQALGDLVESNPPHRPELLVRSYYKVVGRPERQRLDAAIDVFLSLMPGALDLAADYARWINEALANEFSDEVIVRVRVKRPLAHKLEPQVRTFAEWVKAQLETTGSVPQLSLTALTVAPTAEGNVFRKEGQFWTIKYQGQVVHVPNTKGWRYIAYLVHHEGREFHALTLATALEGHHVDAPRWGHSQPSGTTLREPSLHVAGGGGMRFQPEAGTQDEYRRRWNEIKEDEEELQQAERENNQERVIELKEVIDWRKRQLAADIGIGGRERTTAEPYEKARKAISNAINRGLRNIVEEHPALYEHLDAAIKQGTHLSYTPNTAPKWNR